MKQYLILICLILLLTNVFSADRYWVGGSGNWNTTDTSHWAMTSGGTAGAPVPTFNDNVYFDANSGSNSNVYVQSDNDVNCHDLNFVGYNTNNQFAMVGKTIHVYGNYQLRSGVDFAGSPSTIAFNGTSGEHTINTAGRTSNWSMTINAAADANYSLLGNITGNGGLGFTLTSGTLKANSYTIQSFDALNLSGGNLYLGSGTWTLGKENAKEWNNTGTTIYPETSTIEITGTATAGSTFAGGGKTYNNLWFASSTNAGILTITGSNTFNDLKIDSNKTVKFTNSTTTTVNTFTALSTSTIDRVKLRNTSGSTKFTITKAGGETIVEDYLDINNSTATPSSTWYAGNNSIDNGSNTGWIFFYPLGFVIIDWNVYRIGTSTNLTGVNIDCNVDSIDASNQTSPFSSPGIAGDTPFTCNFTRTGYDANNGIMGVADGNKTITVYLTDSTAPTTTFSGATGTWQKTTLSISLNCSDTGSGCATTYYRINSTGAYSVYSGAFGVSDGNNKIDYYSTDNAGNSETPKTSYAAQDRINPIVTGTITAGTLGNNGWYITNVTYTGTFNDATSGIANKWWCSATTPFCNPIGDQTYTIPLTTNAYPDGNYYFDIGATDNAGNSTPNPYVSSGLIKLDKTAPSVGQTTTSGFTIYSTYIKGTGNIYATTSDATSGVNQCYYSTDNGTTWATTNDSNSTHCIKNNMIISNGTTYQFDLNATDNAGNNAKGTATISYTGDSAAPTTTLSFLQQALYSRADVNLYCSDAGSGCKSTRYRIDSNLTWNTYTVPFVISGSGTYTVYFDSNDNIGNQETTTSATVYISPDIVAPTLSYTINKAYGFGVDNNIPYTLTCSGDRLDQLWFDLNIDGVSKLHALNNNGVTKSGYVTITNASPVFLFSCTNQSGLSTTATVQPFNILSFQLVNENTGALIDTNTIDNNFAIAKVYTIDGNYMYDFKANHRGDVNGILPYSQQLVFNFGYNDASLTQINRVINGAIEASNPMRICAPLFQQFYEQQFISYTARTITLYNYPASCYELQGQLNFLSSSNYGLTTYTTNMPFYLYTWVAGVKTFFSLIDGGNAQAYNLDVITLTRSPVVYTKVIDGLGAAPLLNPVTNQNDLNILTIQYRSSDGQNTAVNLQILNGTTVLVNQNFVDANAANAFNYNYNYNGVPGITSSTYFTIRTTSTNPNGNRVTTVTMNAAGNAPAINYSVGGTTFYGNLPVILGIFALIISSLFFVFGLTIASSGNTFGSFGILICLGATALCSFAVQSWYVGLLIGFYLLTILFIMLVGKPKQGYTLG